MKNSEEPKSVSEAWNEFRVKMKEKLDKDSKEILSARTETRENNALESVLAQKNPDQIK